MSKVRLFTAVSISKEAQKALGGILEKVSKIPSGVKWVGPQQFHVTLQFMGDREEVLVPELSEILEGVAGRHPAFDMELGGVDGFPGLNKPKALFVKVVAGQDRLASLAKEMIGATQILGIEPEERDFHAHLTLGRVKDPKGIKEVVEALLKACPERFGKTRVDRFVLFKSQLSSKGSSYTPLGEFELKG